MADDGYRFGIPVVFVLLGLFQIVTRRFWADQAARSIWKMNPRMSERVSLVLGILSVLLGLFLLVLGIFSPAEPAPEVVEAEEPTCAQQLFGAIFGLGFGFYSAINHRRLAEKGKEYIGNTDLLAKVYLVAGIVFILGGLLFATGVYEFCLGK